MRLLVALLVLLAGCADGWVVGHFQTSDQWHQEGAWDALPEGHVGDHRVDVVFFGAGVHDQEFGADDLDGAWGQGRYGLQFVRWDDHGPDATFRTVQFEPDHVQVWLGVELGAQDARKIFLATAPAILAADEELEAMADLLVASERMFDAGGDRPATKVYGLAIERPDFEGAYSALGPLPAFEVDTHIGATGFLPVPGQVTLRQGEWEFHFHTAMKQALAGGQDADLLWVSPTDELQFVHRDRHDLSDAQAAAHLRATLEALGLPVPQRDWTFEHEAIEESLGD